MFYNFYPSGKRHGSIFSVDEVCNCCYAKYLCQQLVKGSMFITAGKQSVACGYEHSAFISRFVPVSYYNRRQRFARLWL